MLISERKRRLRTGRFLPTLQRLAHSRTGMKGHKKLVECLIFSLASFTAAKLRLMRPGAANNNTTSGRLIAGLMRASRLLQLITLLLFSAPSQTIICLPVLCLRIDIRLLCFCFIISFSANETTSAIVGGEHVARARALLSVFEFANYKMSRQFEFFARSY